MLTSLPDVPELAGIGNIGYIDTSGDETITLYLTSADGYVKNEIGFEAQMGPSQGKTYEINLMSFIT